MSNCIRINMQTMKATEVIDLTGDDDVEMFTCDDLYPSADDNGEHRGEQILDVYQPDDAVDEFQYLVKWFGYPKSEATWEWECNLTNCSQALAAFHARKH